MTFEFENDELTASLKIHIEPVDYQQKVDEKLRDYRKKQVCPV